MDIKLPRLPAELWPLILDSMFHIECPLNKFKEIELMLRIGSNHNINCIDVLENGYLKYINQFTSNYLYYIEDKLKNQLPINIYKQILEISFISNNLYHLLEIIYYLSTNDIEVIVKRANGYKYVIEIILQSSNNIIRFRYESYEHRFSIKQIDTVIIITEEEWKTKYTPLDYHLHRIGGPAITIWWFIDEDIKDIIQNWSHGYNWLRRNQDYLLYRMSWYKNGSLHRDTEPARLGWRFLKNKNLLNCIDGTGWQFLKDERVLHFEEWYQENEFYRTDGPVKIWYNKDGTINKDISLYNIK